MDDSNEIRRFCRRDAVMVLIEGGGSEGPIDVKAKVGPWGCGCCCGGGGDEKIRRTKRVWRAPMREETARRVGNMD